MTGKLLVTGASGQLGAAVLRHLIDTCEVPASTIVAGSRDTARLSALAERGVETRRVDFNDAGTLASAFSGVDRVIIISTDALDGEGTRLRQHLAAVAAAKSAGVGRIFYTSMPNPREQGQLRTRSPQDRGSDQGLRPRLHDLPQWLVHGKSVHGAADGTRQRQVVQLRRAPARSPTSPATTSPGQLLRVLPRRCRRT
jgi:hypothetical protein